jgi:DNA-binding SARP family transcriptional activator
MYRLRHALGRDAVLYDGEGYHFNRKLDYEYDAEVFLEKLAQAQKTHEPSNQMAAYRATAQHYKGPYLPDVEGEWVWLRREQLKQAYFEASLTLVKLHLEAKEYDAALEYCERALAEDPCLEEAHRLAMQAHAALGNRAAVARQFDRCRKALHQEVKASPSSQTESLYEILMR